MLLMTNRQAKGKSRSSFVSSPLLSSRLVAAVVFFRVFFFLFFLLLSVEANEPGQRQRERERRRRNALCVCAAVCPCLLGPTVVSLRRGARSGLRTSRAAGRGARGVWGCVVRSPWVGKHNKNPAAAVGDVCMCVAGSVARAPAHLAQKRESMRWGTAAGSTTSHLQQTPLSFSVSNVARPPSLPLPAPRPSQSVPPRPENARARDRVLGGAGRVYLSRGVLISIATRRRWMLFSPAE